MSDWNLHSFQNYLGDTFPSFERSLNDQQDGRSASSVNIDASDCAFSFFFQTLLGQSSIHQLDQWLRGSMAHDLFDPEDSDPHGSDSTLLDAVDGWALSDIRQSARQLVSLLRRQGSLSIELPGQQTVLPAALDGSDFGGHLFSVLTYPGSDVQAVGDLEPYETLGDERGASFQILRRRQQSNVPVLFSHLLLDGLYMNRSSFLRGIEMGFDPVIKTTQEELTCVQTLQDLWSDHQAGEPLPEEVSVIEGEDPCRGFEYEALQHSHIEWNGLTLNGIQIHITHTSGRFAGQTDTYWVFTSDQSLSARGLRQLAHHRWAIENNQFKELNELVGSKSGYIQSSIKKHVILFWQMIGWALFQAFRDHCRALLESMNYGYSMTKSWLIERLKEQTYERMANGPPA
jgi:hypothetical protein